jgi:hypothetical protein
MGVGTIQETWLRWLSVPTVLFGHDAPANGSDKGRQKAKTASGEPLRAETVDLLRLR